MKVRKKTVFLLIDAMRTDYLTQEDSPFLFNLAQENLYYKEVAQHRSYCERAEVFSGMSPRESGYFTALGYSPESSPYKKYFKLFDFLGSFDHIFRPKRLYRVFRNKLISTITRVKMRSYSIPLGFLPYFNLTEDEYDFRDPRAFNGKPNLFSYCEELGIKYFYESFTALNFSVSTNDEDRLKLIEDNFSDDIDFYLGYIGVLDSIAHRYGPDSIERKKALRQLDNRLRDFFKEILLRDSNTQFVLLGDHGMSQVTLRVDLERELTIIARSLKLKPGRDYIYFLDSTICRIWYKSEQAKYSLQDAIQNSTVFKTYGEFINTESALAKNIPFPDERYGDTLWMGNNGVLIFPDFFHVSKPYYGMHGYDIVDSSTLGLCIVTNASKSKVNRIKLTDVYEVLKKALNNSI